MTYGLPSLALYAVFSIMISMMCGGVAGGGLESCVTRYPGGQVAGPVVAVAVEFDVDAADVTAASVDAVVVVGVAVAACRVVAAPACVVSMPAATTTPPAKPSARRPEPPLIS